MVTLMDYEVFVSVNTIDFGQSEWSEALYFTTTDMSYSELAEMDNLINTVVRFMHCFNYNKIQIRERSLMTSHIRVGRGVQDSPQKGTL